MTDNHPLTVRSINSKVEISVPPGLYDFYNHRNEHKIKQAPQYLEELAIKKLFKKKFSADLDQDV